MSQPPYQGYNPPTWVGGYPASGPTQGYNPPAWVGGNPASGPAQGGHQPSTQPAAGYGAYPQQTSGNPTQGPAYGYYQSPQGYSAPGMPASGAEQGAPPPNYYPAVPSYGYPAPGSAPASGYPAEQQQNTKQDYASSGNVPPYYNQPAGAPQPQPSSHNYNFGPPMTAPPLVGPAPSPPLSPPPAVSAPHNYNFGPVLTAPPLVGPSAPAVQFTGQPGYPGYPPSGAPAPAPGGGSYNAPASSAAPPQHPAPAPQAPARKMLPLTARVYGPAPAKFKAVRAWEHASGYKMQKKAALDTNVFLMMDPTNTLVLCAAQRTVEVYDVRSGNHLFDLVGHTEKLMCGVVYCDGMSAVTASEGRALRIWSLSAPNAGECTGKVKQDYEGMRDMVVAADGSQLATACESGVITLWDVTQKRQRNGQGQLLGGGLDMTVREHLFGGHSDMYPVYSLAMDTQSTKLISGSADGSICVWSLPHGVLMHVMKGHTGAITSLTTTPDDKILVSGSWGEEKTVRIWDLESGDQLAVLDQACCIATLSPDGGALFAATGPSQNKPYEDDLGFETEEDLDLDTVLVWNFDYIRQQLTASVGKKVPVIRDQPVGRIELVDVLMWMAASDDGSMLFTVDAGARLSQWMPA